MTTFEKIRDIVAEALYIDDKSTISMDARLIDDLGAESIDFLDIMFRIDKTFGVRIPKGEVEKAARKDLTEEEFAINGVIQEKGLARLRQMMPEVSADQFVPGLRVRDIPTLYTVRTFVHMVEKYTAEKVASAESVSVPSMPNLTTLVPAGN